MMPESELPDCIRLPPKVAAAPLETVDVAAMDQFPLVMLPDGVLEPEPPHEVRTTQLRKHAANTILDFNSRLRPQSGFLVPIVL
jgi:hypothetical protein